MFLENPKIGGWFTMFTKGIERSFEFLGAIRRQSNIGFLHNILLLTQFRFATDFVNNGLIW